MNFFQYLNDLPLETADRLIVSVLFYNNCVGDDARNKSTAPYCLKEHRRNLMKDFFKPSNSPQKKPPNYLPIWSSFPNKKKKAKISSQMEKENGTKEASS